MRSACCAIVIFLLYLHLDNALGAAGEGDSSIYHGGANLPYRVHCPNNYAITEVVFHRLKLPNNRHYAIQNETVVSIFCEALADLYPRPKNRTHDAKNYYKYNESNYYANFDMEQCNRTKTPQKFNNNEINNEVGGEDYTCNYNYYSNYGSGRTGSSSSDSYYYYYNNQYVAGFNRVEVHLNQVKQLCCSMYGRYNTDCQTLTGAMPTDSNRVVDITKPGYILSTFFTSAGQYEATFCKFEFSYEYAEWYGRYYGYPRNSQFQNIQSTTATPAVTEPFV